MEAKVSLIPEIKVADRPPGHTQVMAGAHRLER
jgi:hypothetical protein